MATLILNLAGTLIVVLALWLKQHGQQRLVILVGTALIVCGSLINIARGATPSEESACHRACVDCRVRCKQKSSDEAACLETCLIVKKACCSSCGSGPGPRTTCSCT